MAEGAVVASGGDELLHLPEVVEQDVDVVGLVFPGRRVPPGVSSFGGAL